MGGERREWVKRDKKGQEATPRAWGKTPGKPAAKEFLYRTGQGCWARPCRKPRGQRSKWLSHQVGGA
ncbi:hypothetical protein AZSI13_21120 [Azospira sp. I13]|nr:hypothetical protein AZSI13_21120 [Azospira sp. I13]